MLDTTLATTFHQTPPFSLQCYLYHLANTSQRLCTVCLLSEPIITFSTLHCRALIVLGTEAEMNTQTMTKLYSVGLLAAAEAINKLSQQNPTHSYYLQLQEYISIIFTNSGLRNTLYTATYFKSS